MEVLLHGNFVLWEFCVKPIYDIGANLSIGTTDIASRVAASARFSIDQVIGRCPAITGRRVSESEIGGFVDADGAMASFAIGDEDRP